MNLQNKLKTYIFVELTFVELALESIVFNVWLCNELAISTDTNQKQQHFKRLNLAFGLLQLDFIISIF